jgi:hypothetical protein
VGLAVTPGSRRPRLKGALRITAHYLTVEEVEQADIDQAFQGLSARGLPAVRGEIVEGDVAGYHYYPGREQAVEWFEQEGLVIVDEGFRRDNGWGYRHFLLRAGE